ncbi:wax ester/triacylglycerol synthase family O-acyltransferase [Nocardia coubleae]|uniref:Diacylglycerol O-acyltransferase n=1 Tax=Nocardia coubleae TaxID=356147 RepID=A0A846W126_9NOCA|nr:wax ester/triacylglycerol synthase family O-acyltransferase [Nocardia coubleae]NKX86839.1 wax ester/triacylglycerol synthase family O-acyltransferase [Nocardia coubleae]
MAVTDRVFFAAESRRSPQHVGVLVRFRLPDNAPATYIRDLVSAMRAVDTVVPPFNYCLRSSPLQTLLPAWDSLDSDQVDLDYHCRHVVLPAPGGERELGALVSNLHSQPLDPERPLWEWTVIDGFDQPCWALYFKVHHALMDGVGGGMRAQEMLSTDPLDPVVRPIWSLAPTQRPNRARAHAPRRGIGHTLVVTAALTRLAGRMIRDQRSGQTDLAVPFFAPRTVLNGRIGAQRRFSTQSLELARITAVAAGAGATVNDVFLSIVGGGLRRYLAEVGSVPVRTLTAGIPVNVRTDDDGHTRNAFTMTVMNLATDIADPAARLAAVHRSSNRAKAELRRLPAHVIPLSGGSFMGPFVLQNLLGLGGRTAPPYNVAVSNVAVSGQDMFMAGSRMEAAFPLAIAFHGVGLFVAAFTAAGRFNIGFTGDRDSLPHLQRLAAYTGQSFDDLEAVCGLN